MAKKDAELARKELTFVTVEAMKAKGLLTSRGILEATARAAHAEQGGDPKQFNWISFGTTVSMVFKNPKAGHWSAALMEAAEKCFEKSGDSPQAGLKKIWAELCSDIHGYPYSGQAVKMMKGLSDPTSCVVKKLAALYSLGTETVFVDVAEEPISD